MRCELPNSFFSSQQSPCIIFEIYTLHIQYPSGSNCNQGHAGCDESKTNNINGSVLSGCQGVASYVVLRLPPHSLLTKPPTQSTKISLKKAENQFPFLAASHSLSGIGAGVPDLSLEGD